MALPQVENVPELNFNYEGLKKHSLLGIFYKDADLTVDERKLRAWLLHTLVSSARRYAKARELVVAQHNADQERDGGAILYLFDVSEHLESCISSAYRVSMAIRRLSNTQANETITEFQTSNAGAIEKLAKIRNQFEHMHSQIVSGETGKGPIMITFNDEGKNIQFRNLLIETAALYEVIKGLYEIVGGMYPDFNVNSAPVPGGPTKLVMTLDVTELK